MPHSERLRYSDSASSVERAPRTPLRSRGRAFRRALNLEEKARAAIGARFHLELRIHGGRELAADREPQTGAREVMTPVRRHGAHRLVERAEQGGVDPGPGGPNREIAAPAINRARRPLHEARV